MLRKGFSLVEISIVIVIIGLLAGGILSGRALIQGAKLRKVGMQFDQFKTAVNSFVQQFDALPGDMPNATMFWGETDSDITVCRVTAGEDTETCDGDGSGVIGRNATGQWWQGQYEMLYAWKHMQNAGVIEGDFSGVTNTTNHRMDHEPVVNCPAGPHENSCYSISGGYRPPRAAGHSYVYPGKYGINFRYGKPGTWDPLEPSIPAVDAWGIDKKFDDGMPGTGRIVTRSAQVMPNCVDDADTDNYLTVKYLLNSTVERACALYYRDALK